MRRYIQQSKRGKVEMKRARSVIGHRERDLFVPRRKDGNRLGLQARNELEKRLAEMGRAIN